MKITTTWDSTVPRKQTARTKASKSSVIHGDYLKRADVRLEDRIRSLQIKTYGQKRPTVKKPTLKQS